MRWISKGLLCLGLLWTGTSAWAQGNVAEQYLFQAVNAERAAHGMAPVRWDGALCRAARAHAAEMARRESISHQYPGEAELAERAQAAGARFSRVSENVAQAESVLLIHQGWMRSAHHRDNVLDLSVNRVGIAVVLRDGELFAVEDFDRDVEPMSFDQQEAAVGALVRGPAMTVYTGTEEARATCRMEEGFAGARRPWFVMRFTASELTALPEELRSRLGTRRFRSAEVGACPARGTGSFTSYSVAVLLFP